MAEWADGPKLFEHCRDLEGPLRIADVPGHVRALGFSPDRLPWGSRSYSSRATAATRPSRGRWKRARPTTSSSRSHRPNSSCGCAWRCEGGPTPGPSCWGSSPSNTTGAWSPWPAARVPPPRGPWLLRRADDPERLDPSGERRVLSHADEGLPAASPDGERCRFRPAPAARRRAEGAPDPCAGDCRQEGCHQEKPWSWLPSRSC